MMRKLLLFLIAASAVSFAQSISVKNIEELRLNDRYFYPKLSEDGTKLLLTSENYKGLWLYELNSASLSQLSDNAGAGYEPLFADNDEKVIFRKDEYSGNMKYSSLISVDLNSKGETVIEPRGRFISEAKRSGAGSYAYMSNYKINNISERTAQKTASISTAAAYIENSDLILFVNGEKRTLNPLGKGNYIWPSISPDGSKILFTFAGEGTYISDLEGNILADLGYANAPQWSPDGNWMVYMVDKDNGEFITSSEIHAVTADGSRVSELTATADVVEVFPNWNADNKIVFNTADGKIFLMELNID